MGWTARSRATAKAKVAGSVVLRSSSLDGCWMGRRAHAHPTGKLPARAASPQPRGAPFGWATLCPAPSRPPVVVGIGRIWMATNYQRAVGPGHRRDRDGGDSGGPAAIACAGTAGGGGFRAAPQEMAYVLGRRPRPSAAAPRARGEGVGAGCGCLHSVYVHVVFTRENRKTSRGARRTLEFFSASLHLAAKPGPWRP